jgi:limonene-1,2-epoxide hydrolase
MTTQQVADRYYELAKENKWAEIWDELYSQEVVNREPEHAAAQGIPTVTRDMDAIRAKSKARREMIEELHSQFCSMPVVGGNFFSAAMGRDVTFKGKPRMKLDEIAVFEVKDGKIVLEQFFY